MKKIRLNITKIKNHYYAKIPDLISENLHLDIDDNIEVSIHNKTNKDNQIKLWDIHPEDINEISFSIREDVHTMNMYNRIYVPEKYRFFFPAKENDFILITNVGNIKTHITANGYFTKGLRQWFLVNGPLMPGDLINISIYNENEHQYEMNYIKNENNN